MSAVVLAAHALLFIPGVVATVALYVAVPASVLEGGISPRDANVRSRSLTRGRRWRLLLVVLAFQLLETLTLAAWWLLGLVPMDQAFLVKSVATSALTGVLSAPAAVAPVIAYHTLRREQEGVPSERVAAVFD